MKVCGFIVPADVDPIEMMYEGWGNGYVAVPEGHPWYEVHYDDLEYIPNVEAITYSKYGNPNDWIESKIGAELIGECEDGEYWIIGFDTCRYPNNIITTPKSKVIEMTKTLIFHAKKVANV